MPHSRPRPRISIVVGSARPVRIGRQLADAIAQLLSATVPAEFRILDLREIALPMLDEPLMAGLNQYANSHTLAWAEEIAESDGIVFLTPQYNAGYPASIKNAIDYLLAEWRGKPAAIISYGGHGGPAAARQLGEVLEFIKMDVIEEQPQLVIAQSDYAPDWHLADPAAVVERSAEPIVAAGEALSARALADSAGE